MDFFECDEAVAEHLVQFGKKRGDLVFFVHDFNENGQVLSSTF